MPLRFIHAFSFLVCLYVYSETARLQFRLPDGSNITETFASSETLGTAKIFLNAVSSGVNGKPVYSISFRLGRNDEIRRLLKTSLY